MIPIYKTGNSRAAVGEGGGGAWRTFHIMFLPFPLSSSPCTPALQGSEEFSVKTLAPSHLFILTFALGGIVYMKKGIKKHF